MTARTRTSLLLATITTLLVACGTNAGAPTSQAPDPDPTQAPSPSAAPSQAPSSPVAEQRQVDGTITLAEGMVFSGPGGTIQEALDRGPTEGDLPTLVNGILFRDLDGELYLATDVSDPSAPTFDGPMLRVVGVDNTGPSWDMANAELLGLEEANGIVWHPFYQVLGFLTIP